MEVPANGVLKYANAVGLEHPLSPTLSKDSTTRLVLSEMSRVRMNEYDVDCGLYNGVRCEKTPDDKWMH